MGRIVGSRSTGPSAPFTTANAASNSNSNIDITMTRHTGTTTGSSTLRAATITDWSDLFERAVDDTAGSEPARDGDQDQIRGSARVGGEPASEEATTRPTEVVFNRDMPMDMTPLLGVRNLNQVDNAYRNLFNIEDFTTLNTLPNPNPNPDLTITTTLPSHPAPAAIQVPVARPPALINYLSDTSRQEQEQEQDQQRLPTMPSGTAEEIALAAADIRAGRQIARDRRLAAQEGVRHWTEEDEQEEIDVEIWGSDERWANELNPAGLAHEEEEELPEMRGLRDNGPTAANPITYLPPSLFSNIDPNTNRTPTTPLLDSTTTTQTPASPSHQRHPTHRSRTESERVIDTAIDAEMERQAEERRQRMNSERRQRNRDMRENVGVGVGIGGETGLRMPVITGGGTGAGTAGRARRLLDMMELVSEDEDEEEQPLDREISGVFDSYAAARARRLSELVTWENQMQESRVEEERDENMAAVQGEEVRDEIIAVIGEDVEISDTGVEHDGDLSERDRRAVRQGRSLAQATPDSLQQVAEYMALRAPRVNGVGNPSPAIDVVMGNGGVGSVDSVAGIGRSDPRSGGNQTTTAAPATATVTRPALTFGSTRMFFEEPETLPLNYPYVAPELLRIVANQDLSLQPGSHSSNPTGNTSTTSTSPLSLSRRSAVRRRRPLDPTAAPFVPWGEEDSDPRSSAVAASAMHRATAEANAASRSRMRAMRNLTERESTDKFLTRVEWRNWLESKPNSPSAIAFRDGEVPRGAPPGTLRAKLLLRYAEPCSSGGPTLSQQSEEARRTRRAAMRRSTMRQANEMEALFGRAEERERERGIQSRRERTSSPEIDFHSVQNHEFYPTPTGSSIPTATTTTATTTNVSSHGIPASHLLGRRRQRMEVDSILDEFMMGNSYHEERVRSNRNDMNTAITPTVTSSTSINPYQVRREREIVPNRRRTMTYEDIVDELRRAEGEPGTDSYDEQEGMDVDERVVAL